MKPRPLQDRVLIRRVEPAAKTSCGVVIPGTAQEKPREGDLVAVGPGDRDENDRVRPLDLVSRPPDVCQVVGKRDQARW